VHWVFDAFAVKNNGDPDFTKNVGGVPLGLTIAEDIFASGMKKSTVGPAGIARLSPTWCRHPLQPLAFPCVLSGRRCLDVTAYCDDIEPGGAMDALRRILVPESGEIVPTVSGEINRAGHRGQHHCNPLLQGPHDT
jgi:hypothetical protein